jgi:hypothetical protein
VKLVLCAKPFSDFMKKSIKEYLQHLQQIFRKNTPKYVNDDFGRIYGWWILIDDRKIGELEYVRWDEQAQFWHEYKINLFDRKYESIKTDPDAWYIHGIVLQNKNEKYSRIHSDYIPAIRRGELIAMRGL